ncbi:hypothetical protein C8A01DRAFT_38272 [Parachaetomium inaequale]|uniref:Uncharacterized protein n=1 Tax=Parachaetomium inaequale TaxID=2588326 RepID=A0AAN6SPY3_9PEZI|nr:hypothetical protein C8A01DRAFT_38272 [Parachaetomium inaequale]
MAAEEQQDAHAGKQQDSHAPEQVADPVSGAQQLKQDSKLAAKVKQLEQELSTTTAERDDIQLQRQRVTKYDLWMETGGPPGYYHLAENYRKIRWVLELYLAPRVPWSSLGPDTGDKLLLWTPKAKQFLDSDDETARVVFEAWIWHVLDDHVFSNTKGPWVGEVWNAYAKLERLGACNCDTDTDWNLRFHEWRNFTLGMIQDTKTMPPFTRRDPRLVVEALNQELRPFFQTQEGRTDAERDKIFSSIARIAVETDLAMQFDRTEWSVSFGHPETGALVGFPFDHRFMKNGIIAYSLDKEKTDGMLVDLVTSPVAVQRGLDRGYAYHTTTYVSRTLMSVIVDMDSRPKKAEGTSSGGGGDTGASGTLEDGDAAP